MPWKESSLICFSSWGCKIAIAVSDDHCSHGTSKLISTDPTVASGTTYVSDVMRVMQSEGARRWNSKFVPECRSK